MVSHLPSTTVSNGLGAAGAGAETGADAGAEAAASVLLQCRELSAIDVKSLKWVSTRCQIRVRHIDATVHRGKQ